jgi:hypothetical protein
MQPDFSAALTVWRSAQSGANLSLPNSLRTGKNTGNLRDFDPEIARLSLYTAHSVGEGTPFGPTRTGNYQGCIRELNSLMDLATGGGPLSGLCGRKPKLPALLGPT